MKETTDLWFMAFLVFKGHKIIKFEMLNTNKLKCYFDLQNEDWIKIRTEFVNSEQMKFKMYIEQIKELTR
jgi:hypothetical protein